MYFAPDVAEARISIGGDGGARIHRIKTASQFPFSEKRYPSGGSHLAASEDLIEADRLCDGDRVGSPQTR